MTAIEATWLDLHGSWRRTTKHWRHLSGRRGETDILYKELTSSSSITARQDGWASGEKLLSAIRPVKGILARRDSPLCRQSVF
jgi:hypothetical protein